MCLLRPGLGLSGAWDLPHPNQLRPEETRCLPPTWGSLERQPEGQGPLTFLTGLRDTSGSASREPVPKHDGGCLGGGPAHMPRPSRDTWRRPPPGGLPAWELGQALRVAARWRGPGPRTASALLPSLQEAVSGHHGCRGLPVPSPVGELGRRPGPGLGLGSVSSTGPGQGACGCAGLGLGRPWGLLSVPM